MLISVNLRRTCELYEIIKISVKNKNLFVTIVTFVKKHKSLVKKIEIFQKIT